MGSKEQQRLLPAKRRLTRLKHLIRYESMRRFKEHIRFQNDQEVQVELKNGLINCYLAEKSAKNMLSDKVKFNRFVDSSCQSPFFLGALDEIDSVRN